MIAKASLHQMAWTADGSMLTAASEVCHVGSGHRRPMSSMLLSIDSSHPQSGCLHSWLAAVPRSAAAHGSRVAVLCSLHEAMVVDTARPGDAAIAILSCSDARRAVFCNTCNVARVNHQRHDAESARAQG